VDIAGENGEVTFFFNEDALVSALVEVPDSLVPAIEGTGVGDVEMAHEFAEVAEWCLYQEMKVIAHQDVSMELDGIDVNGLGNEAQENPPVLIVFKDIPPLVATAGYVVNGAGILDAQWSSHTHFYN